MTSLVSRANDLIHFFGANPMLSANKKALAFASAFLNDVCLRIIANAVSYIINERSECHH